MDDRFTITIPKESIGGQKIYSLTRTGIQVVGINGFVDWCAKMNSKKIVDG